MGKRDRTAAAVDPDAPELSPTSYRSRPQQAKRRGASPQETVNATAAQGSITGRTAGTRYPDAPAATAPGQREAGNADAEVSSPLLARVDLFSARLNEPRKFGSARFGRC